MQPWKRLSLHERSNSSTPSIRDLPLSAAYPMNSVPLSLPSAAFVPSWKRRAILQKVKAKICVSLVKARTTCKQPSLRQVLLLIRLSKPRQRIVTDVLDWSKLDAGSITPEAIPFDLRIAVENALETVSHLARSKNISLLLENPVSTDPPMALMGDPHRYRQCLLNLLSNAISESGTNCCKPSHMG